MGLAMALVAGLMMTQALAVAALDSPLENIAEIVEDATSQMADIVESFAVYAAAGRTAAELQAEYESSSDDVTEARDQAHAELADIADNHPADPTVQTATQVGKTTVTTAAEDAQRSLTEILEQAEVPPTTTTVPTLPPETTTTTVAPTTTTTSTSTTSTTTTSTTVATSGPERSTTTSTTSSTSTTTTTPRTTATTAPSSPTPDTTTSAGSDSSASDNGDGDVVVSAAVPPSPPDALATAVGFSQRVLDDATNEQVVGAITIPGFWRTVIPASAAEPALDLLTLIQAMAAAFFSGAQAVSWPSLGLSLVAAFLFDRRFVAAELA